MSQNRVCRVLTAASVVCSAVDAQHALPLFIVDDAIDLRRIVRERNGEQRRLKVAANTGRRRAAECDKNAGHQEQAKELTLDGFSKKR